MLRCGMASSFLLVAVDRDKNHFLLFLDVLHGILIKNLTSRIPLVLDHMIIELVYSFDLLGDLFDKDAGLVLDRDVTWVLVVLLLLGDFQIVNMFLLSFLTFHLIPSTSLPSTVCYSICRF